MGDCWQVPLFMTSRRSALLRRVSLHFQYAQNMALLEQIKQVEEPVSSRSVTLISGD